MGNLFLHVRISNSKIPQDLLDLREKNVIKFTINLFSVPEIQSRDVIAHYLCALKEGYVVKCIHETIENKKHAFTIVKLAHLYHFPLGSSKRVFAIRLLRLGALFIFRFHTGWGVADFQPISDKFWHHVTSSRCQSCRNQSR